MSFPFYGDEFVFSQPDGTSIPVRGWGDQNHAVFETLDNFTIIQNPVTGFYEYATITSNGDEFYPTGIRPSVFPPEHLSLTKSLRITREAFRVQAELHQGLPKPRWESRRQQAKSALRSTQSSNILPAPPSRQTIGDYIGLCLLIQFPDVPAAITQAEVERFCNQTNYSGFGNQGSVYDYFLDNSIGKLRYKTVVAPYYTASKPQAYYTNPNVAYGQRTRELIQEALAYHLETGFDFSGLTTDNENNIYATSVFYSGARVNNWSQGLWPHASRLISPYPVASNARVYDYQITDMGIELTLGTYCHETGHMLCDFPDLYDYGSPGIRSAGIGSYCLMCAGGNADKKNPTQVCAYLKYQAGWANSLTTINAGMTATAHAGTNDFFIYTKNSLEYFIIENRYRSGRDKALPDSGLAIWHVDELGNNSNEQMTSFSHYECSLEQADGKFDLEQGQPRGDDNDLFHRGWRERFSSSTLPNSKWWDGTDSYLDISNISSAGPIMRFSADIIFAPTRARSRRTIKDNPPRQVNGFVKSNLVHPRFQKDDFATPEAFQARANFTRMLEEERLSRLKHPSLVSSLHGEIERILLTIPSWIFFPEEFSQSDQKLIQQYSAVFRQILYTLPSNTHPLVFTHEIAKQRLVDWLTEFSMRDRTEIITTDNNLDFTVWAEDAYCITNDLTDQETYFVEPASFMRAEDELIADKIAPHTNLQTTQVELYFQGGNILIGDDFWLIGADYPSRSLKLGFIVQQDGESEANAISRVYGQHLDHDRQLIVVGSRITVPSEKWRNIAIDGEAWQEVLYFGNSQDTVQPLFHIDMFISLAGRGNDGRYRLLVADPQLAANILGEELPEGSMQNAFDDIASGLSSLGFEVIRNPMPLVYDDNDINKRRYWYFATGNNVIVQNSANSRKVWLPTYGYGSWDKLKATDQKNKKIWEDMDYTVEILPNFHPFAANLGAAHCITKYLERGA